MTLPRKRKSKRAQKHMTEKRSETLTSTLIEAVQSHGWRKIIMGVNPSGIEDLSEWVDKISQQGQGVAWSADQVADDAHMFGHRRVVILIEPEIND